MIDNASKEEYESLLTNELTGKKLELYQFFMKFKEKSFGLREIQRILGWSSVSLVDYHIKRLIELELVKKLNNNTYQVSKLLSIGNYENYMVIGENFVPKELVFTVFSICFFFSAIILGILKLWLVLIISFFIFTGSVAVKEISRFNRIIHQNKD